MKSNKKIVKGVRKAVTKGAKKLSKLETKGKKLMKKVEKGWKNSEPQRKTFETKAKKSAKNMLNLSIQLAKDVEKGIELGLKDANK